LTYTFTWTVATILTYTNTWIIATIHTIIITLTREMTTFNTKTNTLIPCICICQDCSNSPCECICQKCNTATCDCSNANPR
jgi:hypothetical protein